jgi:hypothetical protein
MIFISISALAIFNSIFYAFLLLDILKRNKSLANILRAVTRNHKSIMLTGLFSLIVLFVFTTIGFYGLDNSFTSEGNADYKTFCDDLLQCY